MNGEMVSDAVKPLKALKLKNSRLTKLVAERDLGTEVMKEINAAKWKTHRSGGNNVTAAR